MSLRPSPSSTALPSASLVPAASVRRSLTVPSRPRRRSSVTRPSPTFRALEPYLESDDEDSDEDDVVFFTTRTRRASSSASTMPAPVALAPPVQVASAAPACITLKAAPLARRKSSASSSAAPSTSASARRLPTLKRALASPDASAVNVQRPRTHAPRSAGKESPAAHMAAMVSNGMTCTYASSALARNPGALSRTHSKVCLRELQQLASPPASSSAGRSRSNDLLRALAASDWSPRPPAVESPQPATPLTADDVSMRTASSATWFDWAGYTIEDEAEDSIFGLLSFGARS